MRISCSFKCNYFPVTYQMLGVSLIKQALQNSNPEYLEKLYKHEDKSNKQSKNFCFSIFVKDFELLEDKFKVNDEVIFNFSTPDYEFFINLYNGLLKIKNFEYKGYELKRNKIVKINEKNIDNEEVIFKTLSPVFIKDKKGTHLMPFDEGFEKELNYIIDLQLKNYRGYGLKKSIEFVPAKDGKKKVVKEDIREFGNSKKQTYYVNAYSGSFKLTGDIQDLKDIYQLGIGFRRSQGFGMVDAA